MKQSDLRLSSTTVSHTLALRSGLHECLHLAIAHTEAWTMYLVNNEHLYTGVVLIKGHKSKSNLRARITREEMRLGGGDCVWLRVQLWIKHPDGECDSAEYQFFPEEGKTGAPWIKATSEPPISF